jgi:hypothetical protein
MGWSVGYQVIRERGFDDAQLAQLAALVREINETPWDAEVFRLMIDDALVGGVAAWGVIKLAMTAESEDGGRICEALTRLQELLPDDQVCAEDDHDTLGWSAAYHRFELGAGERRPLLEHGGAGRSVLELVPPEAPRYPPALAAALASLAGPGLDRSVRRNEAMISKALTALSQPECEAERLSRLLGACDPDAVARVGLKRYPAIAHRYHAVAALGVAFDNATDVAALAPLFLEAWRKPRGTYYYGDFPLRGAFASALAAQPAVRDRLIADLDDVESDRADSDLTRRCAERAAMLLGASGDPIAIRRLVAVLRRWRGVALTFTIRSYVLLPAIEALGRHPHPAAAPSLLLALVGSVGWSNAERFAMVGAARARPDLAAPVIQAALEQGVQLEGALAAAEELGPGARPLIAMIEPYLQYPVMGIRRRASETLGALRGTAPAIDETIDPEQFVLHREDEARCDALRAIYRRKDPALLRSLVVGLTIHDALRRQTDYSTVPFWWSDLADLPEEVRRAPSDARLAWVRDHADAMFGPQRILAPIAEVLHQPIADIIAAYGSRRLQLDGATQAVLVAEEAAVDAVAPIPDPAAS